MRQAIRHLKTSDPVLSQIIEQIGPCRIEYRKPEFSTLVRSIVYQQVSGKAAATIYARLAQAAGRIAPASILKLTDAELRAAGLSGQKTKYIRDLAERTLRREIRFRLLHDLDDDEVIGHLTQVKGIGVWTAQMYLIFALQRPDVLPLADLGVRTAIKRLYQLAEMPTPEEMARIAKPWSPWTSIACWYLWRSLDGPAAM